MIVGAIKGTTITTTIGNTSITTDANIVIFFVMVMVVLRGMILINWLQGQAERKQS